jgi:hypothetical protein
MTSPPAQQQNEQSVQSENADGPHNENILFGKLPRVNFVDQRRYNRRVCNEHQCQISTHASAPGNIFNCTVMPASLLLVFVAL